MTEAQLELLRDKYVLWERSSRQSPADMRDYESRASEALKALLSEHQDAQNAVAEIREQFFNLIADARRWDEDVEGDVDSDGRTQITVMHFAEFHDSNLRDLITALGISCRYDETAREALDRTMEISK